MCKNIIMDVLLFSEHLFSNPSSGRDYALTTHLSLKKSFSLTMRFASFYPFRKGFLEFDFNGFGRYTGVNQIEGGIMHGDLQHHFRAKRIVHVNQSLLEYQREKCLGYNGS